MLKQLLALGLGAVIGYYVVPRLLEEKPPVQKPSLPPPPPYRQPPPPPPKPAPPQKIVEKIEREKIIEKLYPRVKTIPEKAVKLSSRGIVVGTLTDRHITLLPDTDFAVITIFDNPVYIEYGKHVDANSQLYPAGATIVHLPPPITLYFRADTATARVFISEWKYVGEKT